VTKKKPPPSPDAVCRQMECDAVRARPTAKNWDDASIEAVVDEADGLAASAYDALVRDHGNRSPEDYLPVLGLKIKVVGVGERWPIPYFSLYDEAENTVEMNTPLIEGVAKYLMKTGRADRATDDRVRQTAIAHEIYHRLVPRPQIKMSWRERLRHQADDARADIVEEIAAVRFSQLLVGLPYSPLEYPAAAKEMKRVRSVDDVASDRQPTGILGFFRPDPFIPKVDLRKRS